jgi:hypothetical protein
MRTRTILIWILAAALVMTATTVALAGRAGMPGRIKIGMSRLHVAGGKKGLALGTPFTAAGMVKPSSVSTDGVSSAVVQVFAQTGSGGSGAARSWSQIATMPADWGSVTTAGKGGQVGYSASVTISSAGNYILRGAVVQTDTVVAVSAPLPLKFKVARKGKGGGK